MPEQLLDQQTIRRLEQLTLVSRKITTGHLKGERRSRRRGSSTDFADYRTYVPGDDLRFLDWKVFGRLERLFLKLFLEEEDLRVTLLLDASTSMKHGEPDKFLYGRRVAAALGYLCLVKMDSLTVRAFGDGIHASFGPKRGKASCPGLLDFLSNLETVHGTSLARAFRGAAAGGRRKGVAIVISDFYDFAGYEEAFRRLFAADMEVLALHILSPQELKPDMQGDIRLVDAEFGHTTDVSMGRNVADLYERTLSAFTNGIRDYVVGRGGHYLLTSTATPFDRLVLDVLRRRGVIR